MFAVAHAATAPIVVTLVLTGVLAHRRVHATRHDRVRQDQRATSPSRYRCTASAASARPPLPFASHAAAAAHAFYVDTLRGRQVWPTEVTAADAGLWFLVDGALIQVCPDHRDGRSPLVLAVHAPVDLAARCWDAGLDVRVREDASGGATLSVIDPIGREIVFAHRRTPVRAVGRRRPSNRHRADTPK